MSPFAPLNWASTFINVIGVSENDSSLILHSNNEKEIKFNSINTWTSPRTWQ
jgi:hypothetical protein